MKYAIVIALALTMSVPAHAQDQGADSSDVQSSRNQYRSPRKAVILGSIIPGAGHIYAGEYRNGVLTYETTVVTIGLGTMMIYFVDLCALDWSSDCKSGPAWPRIALGTATIAYGIWYWVSSARDAGRAAERANERHRRKFGSVSPLLKPGAANASLIGVSVGW